MSNCEKETLIGVPATLASIHHWKTYSAIVPEVAPVVPGHVTTFPWSFLHETLTDAPTPTAVDAVPAGQLEHAVAPAAEYVPATQLAHAILPVVDLYVPAAQLEQGPPSGPVVPTAHGVRAMQALAPACDVFPTAHVLHPYAPSAE
jgi:hypothetical protein